MLPLPRKSLIPPWLNHVWDFRFLPWADCTRDILSSLGLQGLRGTERDKPQLPLSRFPGEPPAPRRGGVWSALGGFRSRRGSGCLRRQGQTSAGLHPLPCFSQCCFHEKTMEGCLRSPYHPFTPFSQPRRGTAWPHGEGDGAFPGPRLLLEAQRWWEASWVGEEAQGRYCTAGQGRRKESGADAGRSGRQPASKPFPRFSKPLQGPIQSLPSHPLPSPPSSWPLDTRAGGNGPATRAGKGLAGESQLKTYQCKSRRNLQRGRRTRGSHSPVASFCRWEKRGPAQRIPL